MGTPDDEKRKIFALFQEKVKRTVFLDNLNPQVTNAVIKVAISQFGQVVRVSIVPNYLEHEDIPLCALVEMENPQKAAEVVFDITNAPFMVSGMPRPVRAQRATEEMFSDRPRNPERKLMARWVDPSGPEFEVGQELKHHVRKHAAESAALLKYQLKEEEKLANHQEEEINATYEKYQRIETLFRDGSIDRLARFYNMRITGDD